MSLSWLKHHNESWTQNYHSTFYLELCCPFQPNKVFAVRVMVANFTLTYFGSQPHTNFKR